MQAIYDNNDNHNIMPTAIFDWFFQTSKLRNIHYFALSWLFKQYLFPSFLFGLNVNKNLHDIMAKKSDNFQGAYSGVSYSYVV